MNRVINWVFGSFFRTLGRILCYLGLGILAGWLMSEFGLFLEVKAETINNTCSSINQACSTNGRYTYSLYQSDYDTYATGTFKTTYNGRADYIVFSFDYDLLGNATYQLSISATSTDFRNISKSNVFIESADSCAHGTGYLDITNVSFSKSKIVITFKTVSNTPRFMVILGDPEGPAITGVSTFGISSIDITTVESNDTQNIIDNQNQNANSIIDNANDNTQSIIDNQNQNNEELKDTINDVFGNECKQYSVSLNNTDVILDSSVLYSNGDLVEATGWGVTDYVEIYGGYTYNLTKNFKGSKPAIVFYDSNKNYVSGISFESLTSIDFTLPENVKYFRLTMATTVSDVNAVIISSTEVCSNKIDETNDKLDNLTGAITDDSSPNIDDLGNAAGWLPPGPVDTIANLPITFFQTLLGKINKSCTPIQATLPFVNQKIVLPCPSTILNQLGNFSGWLEAFGFIAAAWCLYKYFINFYKWVESALSMDEKEQLGKWGGV